MEEEKVKREMKRIFIFLILVFLINLSSADIFTPSTWDDKLTFYEEGKIGKFGYYEINDTTFWIFNNKPIKTIELLENEYSVLSAWNIKEIEIFKPTKLFDKTNYLDRARKNDKKELISSELHLFREWKTKTRTITNNQSCLTYKTTENLTKICLEWQTDFYKEEYEGWGEWETYNFQIVQKGLYQTKTIVTREHQNTGVIDWVDENEGHDLVKWAPWWNNSWNKKRLINLTANVGNFSYLERINYSANMNADFSDVRFLNSTETGELNFTIESKTDSDNMRVRMFSQGEDSIYMYYRNPSATTSTESSFDTHFQPINYWYMDDNLTSTNVIDSVGLNNGTLFGGNTEDKSIDGEVGTALTFDGNDYIVTEDISPVGNVMSVGAWFKTTSNGTYRQIINKDDNDNERDYKLQIAGSTSGTWSINAILFGVNIGGTLKFVSSGSNTYNDGEWHYAVGVNNGTDLLLYIDGNLNSTDGTGDGGSMNHNSYNMLIGTNMDTSGNPIVTGAWIGGIDEVAIWDYDLSPEEIIKLYTYTEPTYTVGAEEDFGADITLISPADALQTTESYQTFRCNSSFDTDIENLTLVINEVNNFTNSTVGTFIDLTHSENLTQGIYIWRCKSQTVGERESQSGDRTLTIHVTTPNVIIHDPQPTINYHLLGNNLTLNWTVTETGENLTTHIKNCTYEYNGVITVLNNTLCTQINQTSFTYVLGVNNLTFNVTDILDLVNSTIVSWNIKVTEINQTFNNQTLEGASEDFSAIIRLGPGETIGVVALVYNETASAGISATSGNNTEIKLEGFIIPQVTSETNLTFRWSIILTGGEIINLSSQNQTVSNINVDNCSSFSNQILNMSMVDEEKQFALSNTTVEIAINLLSIDRIQTVVSLSGNFENENPLGICLNENVTESIMYSLDAIIKYTSIGYAIEYYNLVNLSLDNETTAQQITLYNLNASDSTDFQLTFNGEDFLPVEDALVFVERQYIAENTFKTVELPKTDSNGQTILHLVRNDIIYNIRIVKEGSVLANFLNIIAFCQDFTIGDCTLPLNAQSNTTGIFNYDDEIGILYDSPPVYDTATNTVSFDFTSTSGATKVVEMKVERRDIFGNNSICSNTLISTSGTVSCNLGLNLSNTVLFTTVSIDGKEWIADTTPIDKTNYGSIGFVVWFLLAISLVLMFSESKNGIMLSISLSYIGAVALGLTTGTITGVGSAGIWVLVMTGIGIWKINKNRTS